MSDDLFDVLMIVVAVATLPLGILSLLFVGWKVSVVVFVVGWLLLTPLIPIVGEQFGMHTMEELAKLGEREEAADPLTELKRRYARGEVSDEEFERRVGNLVETEDLDIESDADFDSVDSRDLDRARE